MGIGRCVPEADIPRYCSHGAEGVAHTAGTGMEEARHSQLAAERHTAVLAPEEARSWECRSSYLAPY